MIFNPEVLISFFTLTVLELVLGIDNVVFISILSNKLPLSQREKARKIGLMFAVISRILLLLCLTWVMGLTAPLFGIGGYSVSGRDLILLTGGLFLLGKSTFEIHEHLEGESGEARKGASVSMMSVILQILVLDVVFSLDSVITAIGMTHRVSVMIAAVIAAVIVMIIFAEAISQFIHRHPTVKMLALSFLLLIGVTLIGEGMGQHISKGYIYFAMAFSVFVEMLNLRTGHGKTPPVKLHERLPQ